MCVTLPLTFRWRLGFSPAAMTITPITPSPLLLGSGLLLDRGLITGSEANKMALPVNFKLVDDAFDMIETLYGVGYRFKES